MKCCYGLLLGVGLLLGACQPDTSGENVQVLDPNDIQVGPIRHDSLTTAQVARITRVQAAFAEVYPVSLAQTIDNFQRDAHPDRELAIWETMATAYEAYRRAQPAPLSLPRKKEVFKLLLSRSMMPAEEAMVNANLKLLTTAEARQVLASYEAAPAPLTIR